MFEFQFVERACSLWPDESKQLPHSELTDSATESGSSRSGQQQEASERKYALPYEPDSRWLRWLSSRSVPDIIRNVYGTGRLEQTMPEVIMRAYQDSDRDTLTEIMVEAFEGVSIDQGIENEFGVLNGRDWKWRKARHFDEDVRRDRDGIIVAELEGRVLGFVSTWMEHDTGIGHIPNISLVPECRGQGIGRSLINVALDRFREHGLTHSKIETLAQNPIGNHLYPSCGFHEVARQVHFVAELHPPES